MPLKFKFRKEKLVSDANFYLFHEFTSIWKWDRSSHKTKAHKMFYFVFLLCDLSEDNPLRDIPVEKKERDSLFRAYGDKYHKFTPRERELLIPAIDCYIKYNRTAEERILISFDTKADEIRAVLDKTEPETIENERDGVVNFVSNTAIITDGLKELNTIKKQKINVISAVRKEAMTQRVRGQVSLSPLSKGNIRIASVTELYDLYEAKAIQSKN